MRTLYCILAALAAMLAAAGLTASAQAHDHWRIPAGIAVEVAPEPYRCAIGPVEDAYDGAWYGGEVPAVYRGYVYRPYYRYTAYRVLPRTYPCHLGPDGRWHRG